MVEVRFATPSDAAAILEIYAPYVRESLATFENEVPSIREFSERIEKYGQARPWLVCNINGVVASYVYASTYRERIAYQWCCECSVYTHNDFQGKGIGRELYGVLFKILQSQGYRNVYAVITLPNEASVKLHEKCGFSRFATYENVGYKLGVWKDVGWWKLQLNNYDPKPAPPQKFSEIGPSQFAEIINTAADRILQKLVY